VFSSGTGWHAGTLCLTEPYSDLTRAGRSHVRRPAARLSQSQWLDQHSSVLDRHHVGAQWHLSRSTDGRRRRADASSLLLRWHRPPPPPSPSLRSPGRPTSAGQWPASVCVAATSAHLQRLSVSQIVSAVRAAGCCRHWWTLGRSGGVDVLQHYWSLEHVTEMASSSKHDHHSPVTSVGHRLSSCCSAFAANSWASGHMQVQSVRCKCWTADVKTLPRK